MLKIKKLIFLYRVILHVEKGDQLIRQRGQTTDKELSLKRRHCWKDVFLLSEWLEHQHHDISPHIFMISVY